MYAAYKRSASAKVPYKLCLKLLVFALLIPGWTTVKAEIAATDIQVAARALSFTASPPSGEVRVGIVYAPGNQRSERHARSLQALLTDGYTVGAIELHPVLLAHGDAASADVDLYFLSGHMTAAETPALTGGGKQSSAMCITTDITQVRDGRCILGVSSRPKIEVFVNRDAAAAQGITFSTVFRVMITEL